LTFGLIGILGEGVATTLSLLSFDTLITIFGKGWCALFIHLELAKATYFPLERMLGMTWLM